MITTTRRLCPLIIFLLSCIHSFSQDLRNNSARLSFSVSPVYSSSTSNKDSLLFRGNGSGLRVGGDYFFGKAGIGFSTGFSSSSADDAAINNFLKNSALPPDQLLITKAKQQNMYLLLGPSVRFGNKVELYAHAKGGLFINNSGLISIQQRGALRAAYRNESTDKNIYPGFLTGLSVQYKTKSDLWSFGIGADYMSTRSEVNNYDARRGNGVEGLKLSGNIRDVVAGVSIRYNIFSPRDHASGQSTGRLLPTVNKREIASPRDAASGMASGKRVLPTVNKREIAIDEPGMASQQNCGPVTRKITNGDGSTDEMTFSCPADALAYEMQTSRQTQKRDFGERLHAADPQPESRKPFVVPHILEKTGIISGTLTWASSNNGSIVSNAIIGQSPRSGSTTLNSQSSSTRTTNQSSFGTLVRLSARESGSGQASGKQSREVGSSLATGRRQYQPVFMEGQGDVCNPCLVTAKMSALNNNPLYKENGMSGTNPLYDNNNRTVGDVDCDGVADADVYLINGNNEVVAKTKTERCGDFFFANVPEGNHVVRVSGVYRSKKEYDVSAGSQADLTGTISQADEWMQLSISSGTDNNGMSQKAGISTSRSNLRTKSISIIEADLDGDGEFESVKVTGTFSDGNSRDLTSLAKTGAANGQELVLDKTALNTWRGMVKSNKQSDPGSKTITGIKILNTASSARAIAVFSDGTNRDVTDMVAASLSGNVRQYNIIVADTDGDGEPESVIKTKTKSNQSNDRVAAGDTDGDGIWSPRSNVKMIRVETGDVNGDGTADIAAGNALVRSPIKNHFETGDIPTEQQRTASVGGLMPGGAVISAAMSSGDPIHGVDVKLGMKSKGTVVQTTTNKNGEFEWTNLAAGDYSISFDMNYFLDDETFVTVGGEAENTTAGESTSTDMTERKGDVKVTAGQNAQSLKIQNNNTVRSNRSELKSILIEADLDGDGDYESDITSRISDEITMDNDGNVESQPQQKAGVSTSRSNIRSRSGLADKGEGLYVGYGKTVLNNKDVAVKIIYKARHEMQMSAIRNLK
jgi:hypothetical protein